MALRIPTLKTRTRRTGDAGHVAEDLRPERRPDFDVMFDELLTTRRRYEDLRIAGGSRSDLAATRGELHLLRAAMASVRAEHA